MQDQGTLRSVISIISLVVTLLVLLGGTIYRFASIDKSVASNSIKINECKTNLNDIKGIDNHLVKLQVLVDHENELVNGLHSDISKLRLRVRDLEQDRCK